MVGHESTHDVDPPVADVREAVGRALAEDIESDGDITSLAVVAPEATATASLVARARGVLAGTRAAEEVFRRIDPSLTVQWSAHDGERIDDGRCFGLVRGNLRSILTAERSALNFLTHCSGVATLTAAYVAAAGGKAVIRDTRKTLPGLRALEKAAVRAGGGQNHRRSLSDAVLIKDNHLATASIAHAVRRAHEMWPDRVVEVECDTLDQVTQAARSDPDLVLLDNMTPGEVGAAVSLLGGSTLVEVSGGVTIDTVSAYASAGPDYVSVGAITHSAPALDLALDVRRDEDEDH